MTIMTRVVGARSLGMVPLVLLIVGCAAPAPPASRSEPREQQNAPTRVVVAVRSDLKFAYNKLNPAAAQAGGPEMEELINTGLTSADPSGVRHPRLAEASPTLENGLWKLFPDGTMETTWTIRQGAQWHDGRPFTTEDLLFTLSVVRDTDLPAFGDANLSLIQDAAAKDARTITVRWRGPLYDADSLFSLTRALPLPKHLLDRAYQDDKSSFMENPYWGGQTFVGTGPFQVREWVPGSHAMLAAFGAYVLKRPKIDEMEVRFIPDATALMANILSETVQMTLGRALFVDESLVVQAHLGEGVVKMLPESWVGIHPQLLSPSPSSMTNVLFREAMLRAVDRQQLADEFTRGLGGVPHAFMTSIDEPYWSAVLPKVPRYAYDPSRATQMIEASGYTKRSDGTFYDGTGNKLEMEIRAFEGNDITKAIFVVADDWTRFGVTTTAFLIPRQRQFDPEYRATYPGFLFTLGASGLAGIGNIISARAPIPDNRFALSQNYGRYMSPEYDSLYTRFTTTIPLDERMRLFEQTMVHVAENQVKLGLFYQPSVAVIDKKILNTAPQRPTWNAQDWELRA